MTRSQDPGGHECAAHVLLRSSDRLQEPLLARKPAVGNVLAASTALSDQFPFLTVLGISQPCDLVRNDPILRVGPNWLKQMSSGV